ncbi:MAG: hypothetical protein HKP58_16605, partial [Desulfatitalea sp.]|nr:hypothetical protein [Desulfatitalea sp.]NNK02035.1 hypothetical protein [Desulfatitalea sp.]
MTVKGLNRREFLKLGGMITTGSMLPGVTAKVLADGFAGIQHGVVKIVWLQGQSCSGCSISMLNTRSPDPADLLTRYISLTFHQSIGAAQGKTAMNVLDAMAREKNYILVVEGAIPMKMPEACTMDGRPIA